MKKCVALLCLIVSVAWIPSSAQTSSSDQIAQEMMRAVKDNSPMSPLMALAATVEGDEKKIIENGQSKLLDAAMATTGEKLSGQSGAQILITYMAWLRSRRPVTAEKVAIYEARLKMIDKATIDAWQAAEAQSGTAGNSRMLTLAAIAFHDFLFQGGRWKEGNPARALTRLGSLSRDAVTRWKSTVKGGSYEESPFAARALIAVDGLFLNDKLQVDKFDAALPAARKLLHGH